MGRKWVWVFVDYNMSGLLINSRYMLRGRVFWDFVGGSASSCVVEGASFFMVSDTGWNSLSLLFFLFVLFCFGFVIYHQIFNNVGSVAALIVVA